MKKIISRQSLSRLGTIALAISIASGTLLLPATFFAQQVLAASTIFANGDRVQATANINVRQNPSLSGKILGFAKTSSTGTINCGLAGAVACPTVANGYTWWYITWDNPGIPSGWSVDAYLTKITGAGLTIRSIAPTTANNMTSGQSLAVTGSGFTSNNTVRFGDYVTMTAAPVLNPDGSQTLYVNLPFPTYTPCNVGSPSSPPPPGAGYYAPGVYNVWVVNETGTSNKIPFTVTVTGVTCLTSVPIPSSSMNGIIMSVNASAGSFIETLLSGTSVQSVRYINGQVVVGSVVYLPAGTVVTVQTTPTTVLYDSNMNSITLTQVITGTKVTAMGQLTDIANKIVSASQVVFSQTVPPPPPPPPPPGTATAGFVGSVVSVNPSANSMVVYVTSVYEASSQVIAGWFVGTLGGGSLPVTINVPPGTTLQDQRGNPITLAQVFPRMLYNAKIVVDLATHAVTASTITFTTVSTGAPAITRIAPLFGPPGTSVTITGTGFTPTNNTVNFGTTPIPNLSSAGGTTISFTVPTGAVPGTPLVSVTNANGNSNTLPFLVPSPTSPPPPPPASPVCGNGIIETGEQCDGTNLNGQTCTTQGFSGGTLSCTSSCTVNTARCTTTSATAPAPTCAISASPNPVTVNTPTTLTWSSTNANSCTGAGGWSGVKPISGTQISGNIGGNTTFGLICTGTGGSRGCGTIVTVSSAPPPSPSCTPDGSCNASIPACGQTTTGADNCGNACSLTGPVCSPPPPPASPVCGNRILESGEQCDAGFFNGSCPLLCSSVCTVNDCRFRSSNDSESNLASTLTSLRSVLEQMQQLILKLY